MIKVSVIMPAYNAAAYIAESIKSVLSQSYPYWELIIVDDGSTDKTKDIVQSFVAKDTRIKYLWQPNGKQAKARNTGIEHASGEWIAFLDSDDLWMPSKLEQQLLSIKNNDADVIFTNGYILCEEDQQLKPYDSLLGTFYGFDLYKILFKHNYIAVLSVMLKKAFISKVGFQDESLQAYGCEDWDYWLRCCKSGAKFLGIEKRLFKYRVHNEGTSSNKLSMHMAGCYVLFKNYDAALFTKEEQKEVKERLIDHVRFIINTLYDEGEINKVPYYLKLLNRLSANKLKYNLGALIVTLLKKRSKQFTNYIIHH